MLDAIANKILNHEHLTETELETAVFYLPVVEENDIENYRWTKLVRTIVEVDDRYFAIEWQKGLTEMQDNFFDEQPYEVERKVEVETIEVISWNRKS